MTGQSTLDESAQDTNTFYRRTLHVLSDAGVPFLVGGSHAFLEYTGIVRTTKDFDLFVRRGDMDRAMEALRDAGYRTELTFPHWLGKAWQHDDFVDLVFSSGNGICTVDDGWFDHAVETQVLGMPVKIVPCEELRAWTPAEYGARVRARIGDGPAYLSFDIDVLDPASAPGTGTPEVAGLEPREALAFLRALAGLEFTGFDVVEVAPAYDSPGQITALNAAAVAYDLLALLAVARNGRSRDRS